MTSYVEIETEHSFSFDIEELLTIVAEGVLEQEGCPFETQVNLVLTDNDGIWAVNKEFRNIDRPTDVLSFPSFAYTSPSDFDEVEHFDDAFDPDSGELLLGDIMISAQKVVEQAAEYGHSEKREFAFLVAHSMLHLLGYDHMTEEEALVMEEKQSLILQKLGITRDL